MSTVKSFTEKPHRVTSLEDLLRPLKRRPGKNHDKTGDIAITSVTDDSRCSTEGSLFVAIRGECMDGHDYITDAIRNGASAVICSRMPAGLSCKCPVITVHDTRHALSALAARFYGTGENSPKAIGVTGTDGKTTTTYLIRSILNEAGYRAGLIGTQGYDIGTTVLESVQTTPHPLALHSMLNEMRKKHMSHAAIEVSSHALVHKRVSHVPFEIGVLTNVTEDHLDFHGSIEEYVKAKEKLFKHLGRNSVAVLNADSYVSERYARATKASVLTYGAENISDVRLLRMKQDINGTRMLIRDPFRTYEIKTGLVGAFNCENILAAATVGFASGIDENIIKKALLNFTGVPGRLEKIPHSEGGSLPSVFVDYAHTPNALEKILSTLRPLTKGQLICVFGCGGDRERQKRARMGYIATSRADMTVITSDNSRSENTENILSDITKGINKSGGRYLTEPDRRRAIREALKTTTSDKDVIVVCGKGAEQSQEINGKKIPFDDRRVCGQLMDNFISKRKRTA